MKKVLIIDKYNISSIIAKELINRYLNGIKAYSIGLEEIKEINTNLKKALLEEEIKIEDNNIIKWNGLEDIDFNLIVLISDIEEEIGDKFDKRTKIISVFFDDLKEDSELDKYIEITKEIKERLLPIVRKKLS
jgi:hypothetical protein